MKWWLWLDDERYPPGWTGDGGMPEEWRIARNVADAKWLVKSYGLPDHMSLDHDLGPFTFTGYDFVKWLTDYILIEGLSKEFTWSVHSLNPVGKKNIEDHLTLFWDDWYDGSYRNHEAFHGHRAADPDQ